MKQQTKILLIVVGCVAAASILTQAKHSYRKPIEESEEIEEIIYEPVYHRSHDEHGFLSERASQPPSKVVTTHRTSYIDEDESDDDFDQPPRFSQDGRNLQGETK